MYDWRQVPLPASFGADPAGKSAYVRRVRETWFGQLDEEHTRSRRNSEAPSNMQERPNVLFFMPDELRADAVHCIDGDHFGRSLMPPLCQAGVVDDAPSAEGHAL